MPLPYPMVCVCHSASLCLLLPVQCCVYLPCQHCNHILFTHYVHVPFCYLPSLCHMGSSHIYHPSHATLHTHIYTLLPTFPPLPTTYYIPICLHTHTCPATTTPPPLHLHHHTTHLPHYLHSHHTTTRTPPHTTPPSHPVHPRPTHITHSAIIPLPLWRDCHPWLPCGHFTLCRTVAVPFVGSVCIQFSNSHDLTDG